MAFTPVALGIIVSRVNVVSDNVPDVSSLEAWKRSFIKPQMSDQEKALAIWRAAVMFRHQDLPPKEFLANEADVHDPIKSFNVYGYGQCCCASAHIEALARYIGLDARGWGITAHSVPEINVDGRWCMLDASLINYFRKSDGSIASVEEANKSIHDWYAQHPQLRGNTDKLYQFMLNGGWKNGPSVLAGGAGYDANGWLPAATHGWNSSMIEFGGNHFLYEYGSALGYELNIQLRPGERIVRNWFNKGLHVNMLDGDAPGVINAIVGKDQLRYSPGFGDLAPGRLGNGAIEYDVPLAAASLADDALVYENLISRSANHSGPALEVKEAERPGTLVLRMPSSYVYLGGTMTIELVVGHGGSISIFFSDNNGLDYKPVANFSQSGKKQLDLKRLIFRRYDYRLKFQLAGAGTGIEKLFIAEDIQHSQRALPALAQGENHIHFSTGPAEGTITIEGSTNPDYKGKNLLFTDFHPQLQGVSERNLQLKGGTGQFAVPIETPGQMTRLRVGCHYRARDAKDAWTIQASFDAGKAWAPIGMLEGPHAGFSKYFVFDHVPPHVHSTLLRFTGVQRNTTLIFDLRISADYSQTPPSGPSFAPVKVDYEWDEGGHVRHNTHIANGAREDYQIHCDDRPTMKSITLQLAD